MTFSELLVKFKHIDNMKDLQTILFLVKHYDLELVNKHSGYVNGYDFDELDSETCLALKMGSSIARYMKYKNLHRNFSLRNPKNVQSIDTTILINHREEFRYLNPDL